MPDIFTGSTPRTEGAVAKVVISSGVYYTTPIAIQESVNARVSTGGMGSSLLDYVLLEQISFGEQSGLQKNLSLDGLLFIVTFGDKPQSIRLTGITFARLCNTDTKSGIAVLYNFYKNNTVKLAGNLAALNVNATQYICQLALPEGIMLRGIVEQLKLDLVSKPFTHYKFTLTMTSMPNFR
jgi:hypothetical protein